MKFEIVVEETYKQKNMSTTLSFLSREQGLKKCFIPLGTRFGLSPDITRLLYNFKKVSENEDEKDVRRFHKNMILFMCLDSRGNLDVFGGMRGVIPMVYSQSTGSYTQDTCGGISPYMSWKREYNQHIAGGKCLLKDDLYDHLIPDDKKCEWGIKHSALSKRKELKPYEDSRGFYDSREKLLAEIRIVGEENYTMVKVPIVDDDNDTVDRIIPCPLRNKITYVNTSPWEEIELDYENFLEWKDTDHENGWRIIVDEYGDSSFL